MLNDYCKTLMAVVENAQYSQEQGKSIDVHRAHQQVRALLLSVRRQDRWVFVVGNGGSAAIASHLVVDLTNACHIRATSLFDPAELTCYANDYGYPQAFATMLQSKARMGDVLIAISSSGRSENIRQAVSAMHALGGHVVCLTGFNAHNPLRHQGHVNVWLPSQDYGQVEVGHQLICHYWVDQLAQQRVSSHAPAMELEA